MDWWNRGGRYDHRRKRRRGRSAEPACGWLLAGDVVVVAGPVEQAEGRATSFYLSATDRGAMTVAREQWKVAPVGLSRHSRHEHTACQ